jgi:hypothetical protein
MGTFFLHPVIAKNLGYTPVASPIRMEHLRLNPQGFGPVLEVNRGMPLGRKKNPIRHMTQFL